VQILNGKGEPIFVKPQNLTNNRYKIRLTVDRDGPTPMVFGTTSDIYLFNPDKNEDELASEIKKKDAENLYYCYFQ
jgi:hypothetical protein